MDGPANKKDKKKHNNNVSSLCCLLRFRNKFIVQHPPAECATITIFDAGHLEIN
jgi:hypothetical protein